MQAIIQLTDNQNDQSIDVAVALDSQTLNLASPAHVVAVWVVNNFQEIVQRANNDRAETIRTVFESENANGGGSVKDTAQEHPLN